MPMTCDGKQHRMNGEMKTRRGRWIGEAIELLKQESHPIHQRQSGTNGNYEGGNELDATPASL